jgi:hypothetical protein
MINLVKQLPQKDIALRNWEYDEILIIAIVVIIYCYFRFIRK